MGLYLHNIYLAFNFFVFRLAKFLVQVLGARFLSPALFGYFSYLYSLMDIWNHIFGAGLEVVASRAYKSEEDWPDTWKKAAFLKGMLALLGGAAGFFILDWPYNLLFALWHLFFMQGKLAYTYLNTILYPKGIILSGFIAQAGLLAAAYWGVRHWGIVGFILAFVIERFLESLVLWLVLLARERVFLLPWRLQGITKTTQFLAKNAWPIWLAQLLGVLMARLDSILVAQFLGYEKLALYSLASRVAEAPLFIFAALADSALAYFIRHKEEKKKTYQQSIRLAGFAGLGCSCLLVLFSFFGIEWVFGSQYKEAGTLLASYAWVLVPRALNMVWTSRLLAQGKERILLLSSASGAIFNLLSNVFLLPIMGVKVACLTAIASEIVALVFREKLEGGHWIKGVLLGFFLLSVAGFFGYAFPR